MQVVHRRAGWGSHFSWCRRLVWAALLMLSVAACATRFPPELKGAEPEPVAAILADAYKQASETYLYEAKVSDMAVSGLSDLAQIYDALKVTPEDDAVSVALYDEQLLRFDRPAEMDVDGWANQIAAVMIAIANRADLPQVPSQRLFEAHMEGIAKALGPEVEYVSEEQFWEWLRQAPDSGPNFTFRRTDAGLLVVKLDSDGRLAAEGLRLGDIITAVDDADVATLKPVQLFQGLIGREGSTVSLSVLRGDPPRSLSVQVTRRKAEPPGLRLERHGGIAAFALPTLNARISREFSEAMGYEFRNAKFADKPFTGLLIDLRGASVADTDDAIGFTENFLGSGVKLVELGRLPSSKKEWKAGLPDESQRLPMAVLIDGMSGPGAEIVAAALQDNGRAILIGSSTLGAGVKYDTLTVPSTGTLFSSLGFFNMPATRLYAPSGYALEGRGVLPDVCIVGNERSVEAWLAELQRGEGLIALADRTRRIDPDDEKARSAHRTLCPMEPDPRIFMASTHGTTGEDVALRLALAILKDPDLYKRLLRPSPGVKDPG